MKCEKCNKELSIFDYSTLSHDNKRICMDCMLHISISNNNNDSGTMHNFTLPYFQEPS